MTSQDEPENEDDFYCGSSIVTVAKIVCILGIFGSVLAFGWFIVLIFVDYHAFRIAPPIISIKFLVAYILGFFGIIYQKPNCLVPILIFGTIGSVFGGIFTIICLIAILSADNASILIILAISAAASAYWIWTVGVTLKTRQQFIKITRNPNPS